MSEEQVLEHLGNLDLRVGRIEQFLPTVATRAELCSVVGEAVAPLATKEELREAVAELATKDELREEGERSRRYMQMLFEDLRSEMRLWAESWSDLDRRDARQHAESISLFGDVDRRVMALEAKGRRRRVQ